jgi:polar amino acid transport system permease protein
MSFTAVTQTLFEGFYTTFLIFIITLVCAAPLGLIISFGSMSRFRLLRWLTRTFVWIIRGTPLMLQVIVIFYGPGLIFGWPSQPRLTAVLIAFIINYDNFNPFSMQFTKYSMGAIYMTIANLPRDQRYKRENVILVGLVTF